MPTLPSGSSYPATSKQRPISSLHIYPHHSYPFIYISYINGKRLGQLDASENHKYRKVWLPTLPSASSYLTTSCLKRGPITPLHNAYLHQPSCCYLLLPQAFLLAKSYFTIFKSGQSYLTIFKQIIAFANGLHTIQFLQLLVGSPNSSFLSG